MYTYNDAFSVTLSYYTGFLHRRKTSLSSGSMLRRYERAVNLRERSGHMTPLMVACQAGHVGCVEVINQTNTLRRYLLCAAHHGADSSLVNYKHMIQIKFRNEFTCLKEILGLKKKAHAQILLAHGADPLLRDRGCSTALHLVRSYARLA